MNTITLEDDKIVIRFSGSRFNEIKDTVKTIPNTTFSKTRRAWLLPFSSDNCYNILNSPIVKMGFKMVRSIYEEAKEHEIVMDLIEGIQKIDYRNFDFEPSFLVQQFTTKPFHHQISGIEFLDKVGRGLLLDEMGLGKTLVTIYATTLNPEIKKVLVACPNSLKYTWAKEIERHSDKDCSVVEATITKKEKAIVESNFDRTRICKRVDLINEETFFHIINYESLVLTKELPDYNLLICDEVQRIKNYKTKTFNYIKNLKIKYRVGLTGTPIVNELKDLFNISRCINPDKYGDSYFRFASKYERKDFWGTSVGYRNLNKFKKILRTFSLRRLKAECLDLPDKLFIDYYIDLSKEQALRYDEMENEHRIKIKEGGHITAAIILTAILYLSMITDGVHILDQSVSLDDSAKIRELDKILTDVIAEHKVVLWTRFTTNNIEKLKDRYSKYNPVVLYGGVKPTEREVNINKFQTDEDCRLFIGNPQAGGLGITLTAADIVIFLDKPFSPAMVLQAIDRLHRIGQTKNVTVISIIARGTVDERVEEILKRKINLSKIVLDAEEIGKDSLSVKELLYIFDEESKEEN